MTILKKASTSFIQDGMNMHSALSFHRRKYNMTLGLPDKPSQNIRIGKKSENTHWNVGSGKKEKTLFNGHRDCTRTCYRDIVIRNYSEVAFSQSWYMKNGTSFCPLCQPFHFKMWCTWLMFHLIHPWPILCVTKAK